MLEDILVELKVISKITENQKISTVNSSNISIEKDDFLQGTRRYLWNDSREKTTKTIDTIIDKAIEYSNSCINSTQLNLYNITKSPSEHDRECHFREYTKLKNLSTEINNTVKGIENLQRTYADDAIISSHLDVIIHKIQNCVSEIEKKLEHSLQKNEKKSNHKQNLNEI
tara:strand:+ start:1335 stop:1844 length:510 start_codon:yes stop_codon:yes gene_type:complete